MTRGLKSTAFSQNQGEERLRCRAFGHHQSCTQPSDIPPLPAPRSPARVLYQNCHAGLEQRPSIGFPSRIHTYSVRCQVHVSMEQNVQPASSKADRPCRGRKQTFLHSLKLRQVCGFTSELLLSYTRGQEVGVQPT